MLVSVFLVIVIVIFSTLPLLLDGSKVVPHLYDIASTFIGFWRSQEALVKWFQVSGIYRGQNLSYILVVGWFYETCIYCI